MFTIPINKDTLPFAFPLETSGSLQLGVTDDVLSLLTSNLPFTPQVASGPDKLLVVRFALDGAPTLKLGPLEDVALKVRNTARALLDIVWPEEDPSPWAPYIPSLTPEQMVLVFSCAGQAEVGVQAQQQFPPYALSATLGLQTGASVRCLYLKSFLQQEGSADVLARFFSGLRLPYHVRTAEDLPEEGEVLVFQYDGCLSVQTQVAWGYSLSRYEERELGALALEQKIDGASAVQLGVRFKVAGRFGLEVRRGSEAGWARIMVRKQRGRSGGAAADLSVDLDLRHEDLPGDASPFLQALLGLTIPQQIEPLRALLHERPEHLDQWLREQTDGLTEKLVRSLFTKWYPDKALDAQTAAFLEDLRQVLDRYETLQQQDDRLMALIASYSVDQLEGVHRRLAALHDRSALREVTDPVFWQILRQVLGTRYFDFLTDDEAFAEARAELQQNVANLLAEEWKRVLDLVGLAGLLSKLDNAVAELREVDTPEALKAQAERHLLELAHRLTGRAFEELEGRRLRKAFEELQEVLVHFEILQARLYDRFRNALNQSYKFGLSRSYAYATEREALVDVELDLQEAEGRTYLQQALHGDFSGLLRTPSAAVRLRSGLFTHRSRSEHQLKITLLGWEYARFRELALHTEELVVPQGEGLLHLYDLNASELDRRRRRGEEVQLSFLMGLMAEGGQAADERPDLIDTISRMSCEYAFQIEDVKTTDEEMEAYLELAQYLGLLPPAMPLADYLEQLRGEMGLAPLVPFGAVSAAYQVRYEPTALLDIFRLLKPPSLEAVAQDRFRRIAAANFERFGNPNTRELARAIVCEAMQQRWKQEGLRTNLSGSVTFTIPCGGNQPREVTLDELRRHVLDALYATEEAYVEALIQLDQVMDQAARSRAKPDREQLQKAFTTFVKQRKHIERFLTLKERDRFVNPFFAILDALTGLLQQAHLLETRARRSTMELTIRQEGRTLSKVFVS